MKYLKRLLGWLGFNQPNVTLSKKAREEFGISEDFF